MRPYFEKMDDFGRELRDGEIKRSEENVTQLKEVEAEIEKKVEAFKNAGMPTEKINSRGHFFAKLILAIPDFLITTWTQLIINQGNHFLSKNVINL